MVTRLKDEIKSAMESVDATVGDSMRNVLVFVWLGKALVYAICAVADAIDNLEAALPHEK